MFKMLSFRSCLKINKKIFNLSTNFWIVPRMSDVYLLEPSMGWYKLYVISSSRNRQLLKFRPYRSRLFNLMLAILHFFFKRFYVLFLEENNNSRLA